MVALGSLNTAMLGCYDTGVERVRESHICLCAEAAGPVHVVPSILSRATQVAVCSSTKIKGSYPDEEEGCSEECHDSRSRIKTLVFT